MCCSVYSNFIHPGLLFIVPGKGGLNFWITFLQRGQNECETLLQNFSYLGASFGTNKPWSNAEHPSLILHDLLPSMKLYNSNSHEKNWQNWKNVLMAWVYTFVHASNCVQVSDLDGDHLQFVDRKRRVLSSFWRKTLWVPFGLNVCDNLHYDNNPSHASLIFLTQTPLYTGQSVLVCLVLSS